MSPCAICGEDSFVGVGSEPTWLCLFHFEEYLKGVRETMDKFKEAVRGPYS